MREKDDGLDLWNSMKDYDDEPHRRKPSALASIGYTLLLFAFIGGGIQLLNGSSDNTATTVENDTPITQTYLEQQQSMATQFNNCVQAGQDEYDNNYYSTTDLEKKTGFALKWQNDQIRCHQKYPQSNSESEIDRLRASIAEGEQALVEYQSSQKYLESQKNNNSMRCTSTGVGSSVYTNCY